MDIEPNPGPELDEEQSRITLCSDLPSDLKLTKWNLRSIAPSGDNTKVEEVKLVLKNPGRETHILAITESWLNDSFKSSHIKIPCYKLERIDGAERRYCSLY